MFGEIKINEPEALSWVCQYPECLSRILVLEWLHDFCMSAPLTTVDPHILCYMTVLTNYLATDISFMDRIGT